MSVILSLKGKSVDEDKAGDHSVMLIELKKRVWGLLLSQGSGLTHNFAKERSHE